MPEDIRRADNFTRRQRRHFAAPARRERDRHPKKRRQKLTPIHEENSPQKGTKSTKVIL
jgi:hypothetical protein